MSRRERGASAVEYGLILACIFIVIVATAVVFGGEVVGLYETALGIFVDVV